MQKANNAESNNANAIGTQKERHGRVSKSIHTLSSI